MLDYVAVFPLIVGLFRSISINTWLCWSMCGMSRMLQLKLACIQPRC